MIYGTDMGGFASCIVHKRLIGAIGGFLTGGPAGAIGGFLRTPSGQIKTINGRCPPGFSARSDNSGICDRTDPKASALSSKFHGDTGCIIPGQRRDPRTGECAFFLGEQTGRDPSGVGEAVMGQYGAGLMPGNMVIDRAVCLRGMQLGNDGLCYNKGQITNRQRMWPAGRRPLLTGGDMRAISTAARAGKRLEGATKRLQKLGLMRKPAPRRKLLTSGPSVHHHHDGGA